MITRLFHRKLVQIETCSTSFDLATFLNSLVTNKVSLGGPRKDTLGKSQNNLESNDKEASKIISAAFLSPQVSISFEWSNAFVSNVYRAECY